MLNLSIPRTKSFSRTDFPQAIGVICNLQIQYNNISFELVAFGDQTAHDLLTTPSATPAPMMPAPMDGIVFKKHFSTDLSQIDAFASQIDSLDMAPSALIQACCYEYVKSLANPLD